MPRRCIVCDHQDRRKIDTELAEDKVAIKKIAEKYGVSVTPMWRHNRDHLRPAVIRAAERREDLTVDAIVERLRFVADELQAEFEKAAGVDKARIGKEVIAAVAYLGKTIGLFTNAPAQNDNRTLIINGNLDRLSVEELRALMPGRTNSDSGDAQKA